MNKWITLKAVRTGTRAVLVATAVGALTATACAGETGADPAPLAQPPAPADLDIEVDVGVPPHGQLGFAFATFHLDRALTTAEREAVPGSISLSRSPGRDAVVVATATPSGDGKRIELVATGSRLAKSRRRRAPIYLEATIQLDMDGTPRLHRSSSGELVGGPYATSARSTAIEMTDVCKKLQRIWRRPPQPVLLTPADGFTLPHRRVTDGTKLVRNDTLAGLILDQSVGTFCRYGLTTPWLVEQLGG